LFKFTQHDVTIFNKILKFPNKESGCFKNLTDTGNLISQQYIAWYDPVVQHAAAGQQKVKNG
jgi:hypothetical protein